MVQSSEIVWAMILFLAAGATSVTGFRFQFANDSTRRDVIPPKEAPFQQDLGGRGKK
jgi:hypothetical protein